MRINEILNDMISSTQNTAPAGILESFYQLSQKYPFALYMENADELVRNMGDYRQLCKQMQYLYH